MAVDDLSVGSAHADRVVPAVHHRQVVGVVVVVDVEVDRHAAVVDGGSSDAVEAAPEED